MKKVISCVLLMLVLTSNALALEVPTDTVVQNLNGSQQAIKTFTVSPEQDPAALIEEPFELEGYLYTFADIVKSENPVEETQIHTEVITVETTKDDLALILEQLKPTIEYDDGRFQGKIMLEELPEYKKLKKCSVFDYVPEWKKREEEGAKRRTAGNRTSAAARNTSSAPPAPQPSPASGKRPDMQPQTSPTEEAAASGSSCGNDNMTPEEIGLVEMTCEAILEGDDPELEEMDDPTRIPPGRGI